MDPNALVAAIAIGAILLLGLMVMTSMAPNNRSRRDAYRRNRRDR